VVHGPDGDAQWGVAVCDVDGAAGGARTYARLADPELLADAEAHELVGSVLDLRPQEGNVNVGVRR
jgi:hypothetical protein